MADRPRFGPAGVPPQFKLMKAALEDIPVLLHQEGLDAFEYEAIYWGTKPQINKESAERLRLKAKESDVLLSMHGSYFMNFCGAKEVVEASKKRLIACATAAEWMGAYVVVFHPGFYGKNPREKVLRDCIEALRNVTLTMRNLGITNVKIGPETTGRNSQLGSLTEILRMCEEIEQIQLVIDWSHLHARDMGCLKTLEDFRKVIETIESGLGLEAARNMHCHFTKIEFGDRGERRHRTLEEDEYGPDFAALARVIMDFRLRPVIISESPLLDIDSMKMRDILGSFV